MENVMLLILVLVILNSSILLLLVYIVPEMIRRNTFISKPEIEKHLYNAYDFIANECLKYPDDEVEVEFNKTFSKQTKIVKISGVYNKSLQRVEYKIHHHMRNFNTSDNFTDEKYLQYVIDKYISF